jgi:UDP-N-acetylmuramoyl-L-alanyl-D-glutamate--2,6-diaminopimelate ligase
MALITSPKLCNAGRLRSCAGRRAAPDGTPVVEDADPRRRLALIAARFFGVQPEIAVAVTGTNGKTSVASFVRQLWEQMGFSAASLGTVGVVGPSGTQTLAHTTPDPIELHRILADLARSGVTHLALEASSHGLEQRRIDGVRLAAGAFTNISRDHLDYHPSCGAYFNEKLRLFGELLPPGAGAVIDVDTKAGEQVAALAGSRGLSVISVGRAGKTLRLISAEQDGFGQRLTVEHPAGRETFRLLLVGAFQASNALVAAGLCMATGARPENVLPVLQICVARATARSRRHHQNRRAHLHRLCSHARRARQARCVLALSAAAASRGVRLRRATATWKRPEMGAAAG